nr:hypothetical protein [Yersinia pekkanenii]
MHKTVYSGNAIGFVVVVCCKGVHPHIQHSDSLITVCQCVFCVIHDFKGFFMHGSPPAGDQQRKARTDRPESDGRLVQNGRLLIHGAAWRSGQNGARREREI